MKKMLKCLDCEHADPFFQDGIVHRHFHKGHEVITVHEYLKRYVESLEK